MNQKPWLEEGIAADLFDNRKAPFVLNLNDPDAPTLTVVSAKGEKIVFTGKQTAESKYQSQGETVFFRNLTRNQNMFLQVLPVWNAYKFVKLNMLKMA